MLQRRVGRIAVFAGTDKGLSREVDFCKVVPADLSNDVSKDLISLFGYGQDSPMSFMARNTVFRQEDFQPVLCELSKLQRAGKPAVILKSLQVQENKWWGIPSGWQVDLLIYYNDVCRDFEALLPKDTQNEIAKGRNHGRVGELVDYPLYKTVFQNAAEGTALTEAQTNLLAAQVEYAVKQNSELFQTIFE